MSKKVTYLLGAGASAQRMPVLNGMKKSIRRVIRMLKCSEFQLSPIESFYSEWDDNLPKSKKYYQNELISDLEWLAANAERSVTVDTFAKKLLLARKHDELLRFKRALTFYLVLEELTLPAPTELNHVGPLRSLLIDSRPKEPDPENTFERQWLPYDTRYEPFLASILRDTNTDFPDNVSIVSWNYDSQIEKAYADFLYPVEDKKDINIAEIRANLKVTGKGDLLGKDKFSGFNLLKLNGTTVFREVLFDDQEGKISPYSNLAFKFDFRSIEKIVEVYSALLGNSTMKPTLSFAWEGDIEKDLFMSKVADHIADTEVLVVIGYSFPYFNREIDKHLWGASSTKKLQMVYFQDAKPEVLKERFQSFRRNIPPKNLITIEDIGQFYMPPEL